MLSKSRIIQIPVGKHGICAQESCNTDPSRQTCSTLDGAHHINEGSISPYRSYRSRLCRDLICPYRSRPCNRGLICPYRYRPCNGDTICPHKTRPCNRDLICLYRSRPCNRDLICPYRYRPCNGDGDLSVQI